MRKLFIFLFFAAVLLISGCSLGKLNRDTGGEVNSQVSEDEGAKSASSRIDNGTEDTGKTGETARGNNTREQVDEYSQIVLYYQDGDGFLIPVTRRLPKQDGIAKAYLKALIDNPALREEMSYYGIYPILPEGTEILGMSIKEDTAVVDFNEKLLNYKNINAERNIINSVVYTLTGFDTITRVEFMIGGEKRSKMKFGTDLSTAFTRENLLLNSDHLFVGQNRKKADIYFTKQVTEDFVYLVPISVEFEKADDKDLPFKIFEFLKKENSSKKLYTEIEAGSVLLGCSIEDGILSLYFNKAFGNYGGNSREDIILKQLYYSMKQVTGVEKIRIFVDSIEGNLPEGTDITGGYAFPDQINNFIDR